MRDKTEMELIEELATPGDRLKAMFAVASIYVCKKGREVAMYLARSFESVALVCLALSLPACAQTEWVNPSMPPSVWAQTQVNCEIGAARAIPPRIVTTVEPGSFFETNNCHKGECSKYVTVIPPQQVQQDVNEPLREKAKDACLMRNGGVQKTL